MDTIRGEFYNSSTSNKTYQGKAKTYIDDSIPAGSRFFYKETIVGDVSNMGSGIGKAMKKVHHGINRARYKVALLKNQDCHIHKSFDPWAWD